MKWLLCKLLGVHKYVVVEVVQSLNGYDISLPRLITKCKRCGTEMSFHNGSNKHIPSKEHDIINDSVIMGTYIKTQGDINENS